MSTRSSIKWREQTDHAPGFHLYEDCMETLTDGEDAPVYLRLDGVAVVDLSTLTCGGATVEVCLPRELARSLGLLPVSQPPVQGSGNG